VRLPLGVPTAPGVPQPQSGAQPSADAAPNSQSSGGAAPSGQVQPGGGQPSQIQPGGGQVPIRALPAGAVLVAVQNSAISARTDEAGSFSLQGVPAGQYLTIAAGPVANSTTAIASRPNVFVNGGQTVDVGTLVLGGQSPVGFACRPIGPLPQGAAPSDQPGGIDQSSTPATDQSP
jgi:hypothetical protein